MKFLQISLEDHYNASSKERSYWSKTTFEAINELPFKDEQYWGIPFNFSKKSENILILNQKINVSIPINNKCTFIVFSHFCDSQTNETKFGQSDDYLNPVTTNPGETIAEYSVEYSNGEIQNQKIRRRFEISQIRSRMQSSFVSRQYQELRSLDFRGPYPDNSWGRWHTGVFVGDLPKSVKINARDDYHIRSKPPASWTIYALEIQNPNLSIKNITLKNFVDIPIGVGAITLYNGSSHPLKHLPLQTIELTKKNNQNLHDVKVDMGVIARKNVVNKFNTEKWVNSDVKGWGEILDEKKQINTVDITANQDSTLNVDGSDIDMSDLYLLGETTSKDKKIFAKILYQDRTWVHGRIIDSESKQPIPARIHFRSKEGIYFPPYGHTHEVNDNWFEDYGADLLLGDTQYAYVDGLFQGELPTGEVYVEVSKGFEYTPIREKLIISPGQKKLDIELSRSSNLQQKGWFTADTHVHFLSTETARLEASAEDINVINLLAAQWGDLYTNVADITGKISGSSDENTIVWVGTENRQHFLGHISLMGATGDPIFPLSTSGPTEGYIGDPTALAMSHWADESKSKGGLSIVPHFPFPHSEVLAEVILGKVDGLEIRDFHVPSMDTFAIHEWYRLLNCGYRVPCVGGTDKMSASMPVGGVRTYAYLGDKQFNYENWSNAIRKGRTYTTSGPLMEFSVEGLFSGDNLNLPSKGGKVFVSAKATCFAPIHRLDIVVNGNVVYSESSVSGDFSLEINEEIIIDSSGWIAARVYSENKAWHVWPVHLSAHTSPIYINVGDQDVFNSDVGNYLITTMQGGIEWLDTLATESDSSTMKSIKKVFQNAIKDVKHKSSKHHHHHH